MEGLSQKQKGATFGVYVVILSVYFVIPDMGYISPSLSAIAGTYGVDAGTASYLATIVALTQVAGALVCGAVAGRRVRHKTLLSVAVAGMAVFGMIPGLFTPDVPFVVLMADRAVFGFFLGFLQPIIFAYIAHMFIDANRRASAYGWGNVAFNAGAVFASSVGGICVGIGWNTAFWLYGIGLVVLVCVLLFFEEPKFVVEEVAAGGKAGILPIAWFFMSVFLIAQVLDYPFFTAFIDSLIGHGITDGIVGGQLLSLFTLVGVVASASFGRLFRGMSVNVLPFACLVAGLGMAMIYLGISQASSLAFCVVAVLVVGFGHTLVTVSVPQCVSISCSSSTASAALAFTAVFMNVGVFISSPYMQLVTGVVRTTDYTIVFLVSGVIMIALSLVVFLVLKVRKPIVIEGEDVGTLPS